MQVKSLKKTSLIRGSLYSLFSFFNQGSSFLLLILLANYINPAEYGKLSMFNTLVQLLTYFIAFSASGYISVSYFSKGQQEFRKDFSSIMLLGVISLFIIVSIIGVCNDVISHLLNIPSMCVWIGVVICLSLFLHNINLDIIRINENIKEYGIFSCSNAILNFILSLILVIGFNMNWEGRVFAQFWTNITFGIIAIYLFNKRKLFTYSISYTRLKSIAMWGMPLIPHLASSWIKQGCDRLIINSNYSIEEVGLFSFALNLTSIITMIGLGFNQVNSVDIYKILGDNEHDNKWKLKKLDTQRREVWQIYIVVFIVVVITCILGVPILLPKYSDSIIYFIPLSIYGLGVCIYLMYCNYLFYYDMNKYIMMITFTSSLIHLLLSLFLTRYSLFLTAIIYVVMQLYIVVLLYHESKKLLQIKLI